MDHRDDRSENRIQPHRILSVSIAVSYTLAVLALRSGGQTGLFPTAFFEACIVLLILLRYASIAASAVSLFYLLFRPCLGNALTLVVSLLPLLPFLAELWLRHAA